MENKEILTLKSLAIGSLPHASSVEAMKVVEENFSTIPFWPQLAHVNKKEDMTVQFLEGCPAIVFGDDKVFIDNESDLFFEELESLFVDYEEIMSGNYDLLDKYGISDAYSSTFNIFVDIVKNNKCDFAKGQIVGPFTLATTLTGKDGRLAFYDETLREVITKLLTLKALWQIKKIKSVNEKTKPIIFIDEPSLSQLGTSAFVTISRSEVVSVIKEISDVIKNNGSISAIHCCGKSDWTIPIDIGVDIINLDGFLFAQNLSLFSSQIEKFVQEGGYIAWGIVPTLDKEALNNTNIIELEEKFELAIKYLSDKGLDKKMLIEHSMITPSCGAGALPLDLAQKAMRLTKELSAHLLAKYKEKF